MPGCGCARVSLSVWWGSRERRWWPAGFSFVDGAVAAGAKALSACGIDASDIGLMLNTSVSRQYLEPSTAVAVHHGLGLPSSCQNFDITNACLGFVNGMELGAVMIDSGVVDYVLVVDGEDSRTIHEATLSRLSGPGTTSRRRDGRVRRPDAGLRGGGDGPRPGGPAPRGAPAGRCGEPGGHRAPRALRR